MTINGSTNSNGWTYKLEVTETATSVQNRTSTIQVKTYIGRSNSQSYLGGNYSNSVTCAGQTQTQSGNITWPTYINGGAWLELKTFTFTVSNTGNPTTISISSTMSSSDFTPSYSSASGSMTLTILHQAPLLSAVTFTETNAQLTGYGVGNDYFVPYLSKKAITITASLSDSASMTLYEVLNKTNVYSSANDTVNMDLQQNDLYITYIDFLHRDVAELSIRLTDSMGGKSTTTYPYSYIIPYTKPNLEKATTTIKRKSGTYSSTLGRIANLTDNIADLLLTGYIYKQNDAVGNNNSITKAGYKVWERDASEPANYTSVAVSVASDGKVTLTNAIEISNIDFTKVYKYKIIIADNYKDSNNNYYDYVIEDTIPLGQPTWTEYKDRVDFLKLTVGGYNPFEYSDEETVVGVWIINGVEETRYRKVIDIGYLPNASTSIIAHNISNLGQFTNICGLAIRSSDKDTLPIPYVTFNANNSGGIILNANSTYVNVTTSTDRSAYNGYVVIEYTKS